MPYAIGIDLGTTYSAVAVVQNGTVEVIANDQGNRTTPSVVAYTDTERLIGDAAQGQFAMNPVNTVYESKRLIGRRADDADALKDRENFTYKTVSLGNKIEIEVEYQGETKRLLPEQIGAAVLEYLKKQAEAYLGETVTEAVITVPAYFNDAQRRKTEEAAIISGLKPLRIINEPTAADVAYGLKKTDRKEDVMVLVFDQGGGTHDCTVLEISDDGTIEVLATAGDTHLGGSDYDQRLVEFLAQEFKRRTKKDM